MLNFRFFLAINRVTERFGVTVVPTKEWNSAVRCLEQYNNSTPDELRQLADDLEADME